ncbi:MAG: DUF4931 domain-containing protein [Bacillota bacterium]
MSIMRQNPFTKEWVIYAKKRNDRPHDFSHDTKDKSSAGKSCPFCKEGANMTPNPVYTNQEDYTVRVFQNLYPAVDLEEETLEIEPFYETTNALGYHEIIVDTTEHGKTIDMFSEEEFEEVFKAIDHRYAYFQSQKNTKYIQIFKNCGPLAGMSIRHSHWQLVTLPRAGSRITELSKSMQKTNCLMCEILSYEEKFGKRVVAENTDFIAVTPYASKMPYEVWICAKKHIAHYGDLSGAEKKSLQLLLSLILKKLVKFNESINYNICFMEGELGNGDFHFHVVILPRSTGIAGLEFSTGAYINAVLPEEAKKMYDEMSVE